MPGFIRHKHSQETPGICTPEPDELSHPDPQVVEEGRQYLERVDEERARGRGRPKGLGLPRKSKVVIMGIPKAVLDRQDPRWAAIVRQASNYRKARIRELALVHGYVSAGCSALLGMASMALSASRFLYETAGDVEDVSVMAARLKQAAQLGDSARQNELAAWELCAREGIKKRQTDAASAGTPWIKEIETPSKAGRPSKALTVASELQPVQTTLEHKKAEVVENRNLAEPVVWEKEGE